MRKNFYESDTWKLIKVAGEIALLVGLFAVFIAVFKWLGI